METVGGGRNLTYALLDAVGKAIVTGQYDTVAFPTEADLAQQYAVSRSVTREAVKMLTAKGLLAARPRKGTTVQPARTWNLFDPDVLRWMLERKFSLDLLRQFSELRIAIEPMAAMMAARAGNADERPGDLFLGLDLAAHIVAHWPEISVTDRQQAAQQSAVPLSRTAAFLLKLLQEDLAISDTNGRVDAVADGAGHDQGQPENGCRIKDLLLPDPCDTRDQHDAEAGQCG